MLIKIILQQFLTTIVVLSAAHTFLPAQDYNILSAGEKMDSSYYDLAKISDNSFWAGGEYGILKNIDTLGNLTTIDYPSNHSSILKIERHHDVVFLSTDNGTLYTYNLETETWKRKCHKKLRNRAIYNFIIQDDGSLVFGGGSRKVANAHLHIPCGFIATVDANLENLHFTWKSWRKFVWSIYQSADKTVYAACFNGLGSQIMKFSENRWHTERRVKGLVHHMEEISGETWFCGSKSIFYKCTGLLGALYSPEDPTCYEETGCFWSMDVFNDELICQSQSGGIVTVNLDTYRNINSVFDNFILYEIELVSQDKYLMVGSAKTIIFATTE